MTQRNFLIEPETINKRLKFELISTWEILANHIIGETWERAVISLMNEILEHTQLHQHRFILVSR